VPSKIWFASLWPGASYLSAGGRRIGGSSAQSPFSIRSSRGAFYGQPERELMIKIMQLLHRRPDLSVEEFRRHWHGVTELDVPLLAPRS
jgi:hypothetical protein